MKLTACIFLVPEAYNDGRPVEPEAILEIKRALDRQFGGYTCWPAVEGSWQGQSERMLPFKVCVAKKRIPELKKVVVAIGKRLGQKAMYFEVTGPNVEIIDTSGEEREGG